MSNYADQEFQSDYHAFAGDDGSGYDPYSDYSPADHWSDEDYAEQDAYLRENDAWAVSPRMLALDNISDEPPF